jgi:hypothetical protein
MVMERFGKVIPERTKISPLVFAGQTMIGPLNSFIHVWAYKDAGERERLRGEAAKKVAGWHRRLGNLWSHRRMQS